MNDGRLRATLSLAMRPERQFASRFYARLFAAHPDLRALFPKDMSRQERKLLEMLDYLVDQLEDPARVEPLLEGLGRRHVAYGVKPGHYDAMGKILIRALAECATEEWRDGDEALWHEAYRTLVAGMTP